MNELIEQTTSDELELVFDGAGNRVEEASKCDDQCVGGSANTAAMKAATPGTD